LVLFGIVLFSRSRNLGWNVEFFPRELLKRSDFHEDPISHSDCPMSSMMPGLQPETVQQGVQRLSHQS
jgi:hypothetical protein